MYILTTIVLYHYNSFVRSEVRSRLKYLLDSGVIITSIHQFDTMFPEPIQDDDPATGQVTENDEDDLLLHPLISPNSLKDDLNYNDDNTGNNGGTLRQLLMSTEEKSAYDEEELTLEDKTMTNGQKFNILDGNDTDEVPDAEVLAGKDNEDNDTINGRCQPYCINILCTDDPKYAHRNQRLYNKTCVTCGIHMSFRHVKTVGSIYYCSLIKKDDEDDSDEETCTNVECGICKYDREKKEVTTGRRSRRGVLAKIVGV